MVPLNYWAVILAAAAGMVLGFLWYGPLFGKKWAMLSGLSMDSMKPKASSMIVMIIGSFLMSFILDHALIFANAYLHTSGISSGFMVGFLNWLGFIAPVSVGVVLWEGKSWSLWFLNAGFYLVELLLMGAILAVWM